MVVRKNCGHNTLIKKSNNNNNNNNNNSNNNNNKQNFIHRLKKNRLFTDSRM